MYGEGGQATSAGRGVMGLQSGLESEAADLATNSISSVVKAWNVRGH